MTVVAIDGPVGSGKSTVARLAAERLGFLYLDTGAMYRGIGLLATEAAVSLDDEAAVGEIASRVVLAFDRDGKLRADGRDVSAAIRTLAMGAAASRVSALPRVRELLVERQRALAAGADVVMEGRDIGTSVFPDATVKVYLTARPEVRAARRADELRAKGEVADEHEVLDALLERDRRDMQRQVAPLRQAPDAVAVDTSEMTIAEVVAAIVRIVEAVDAA